MLTLEGEILREFPMRDADVRAAYTILKDCGALVTSYVRGATTEGYPEDWDLEQLWTALRQLYPVGVTVEQLEEQSGGGRAGLTG